MIPDPLNALQNLASQGNRNPQMMSQQGPGVSASNHLQNFNQQRPGQQMQGIRPQMSQLGNVGGVSGQQQMLSQMSGPPGMMNVMGGPGVANAQMGGSSVSGGPVGPQQGMTNQMNQMGGPGGGHCGPMGPTGPGGSNQMQMNAAGQMQGGPVTMGIQQMPNQLQQQQMQQINMQHPQQFGRMNQGAGAAGGINVVGGPNAGPNQGMQGLPPNMQQNQGGIGAGGQMHAGAGPQHGQPVGMTNAPGQQGNLKAQI